MLAAALALVGMLQRLPCAQAQWCSATDGDFSGNDILPPNPPPTASAEACCEKCAGHAGCVAFSFATVDAGTCYLKSKGSARDGTWSLARASHCHWSQQ